MKKVLIRNMKNTEFDWLKYCTSCNSDCCHNTNKLILENECTRSEIEKGYIDFNGTCALKNPLDTNSEIRESYNNRPLECRLFPFDVKEINEKLVWVMWNRCHATPKLQYEKFIDFFERSFSRAISWDQIKQYVEQTKLTNPEKYKVNNFIVIREVNWPNE